MRAASLERDNVSNLRQLNCLFNGSFHTYIYASQFGPLWRKFTFPHKGPIMWNTIPCHEVIVIFMMTSSNGNIFRVTGHLCGEFTGPGEFPTQRSVTRSFDLFFDLRPNKRLSKQSWGWWFETLLHPLWRHRNGYQSDDDMHIAISNICKQTQTKVIIS